MEILINARAISHLSASAPTYHLPGSLLLRQRSECLDHFIVQTIEHLSIMFGWLPGQLELHISDLFDDVLHSIVDRIPHNLMLTCKFRHGLLCCLMEAHDDLHHSN